jgi:hypothetical protein
MVLMDTVALDRDVAVRRIATAEPRAADHALRWLCCPSPNSISGPSNWVITLTQGSAEIGAAGHDNLRRQHFWAVRQGIDLR